MAQRRERGELRGREGRGRERGGGKEKGEERGGGADRTIQKHRGYLEEGINHLRVLQRETDVQCGRQLKGAEVPAPLAHSLIDRVDAEARGGRPKSDHAHVRLSHNL